MRYDWFAVGRVPTRRSGCVVSRVNTVVLVPVQAAGGCRTTAPGASCVFVAHVQSGCSVLALAVSACCLGSRIVGRSLGKWPMCADPASVRIENVDEVQRLAAFVAAASGRTPSDLEHDAEAALALCRSILGSDQNEHRVFMLAALALLTASRECEPECLLLPDEENIRAQLPCLECLEIVAESRHETLGAFALDSAAFDSTVVLIEAFAGAVFPRNLSALLLDREQTARRIRFFSEQAPKTEHEVRVLARSALEEKTDATHAEIEEFLTFAPASRLKTYPESDLQRVFEVHRCWAPLVHYLSVRRSDSPTDDVIENQLADLLGSLRRILGARWRGTVAYDIEDAAQDALSRAIADTETASGYCYEVEYPVWLASAAANGLRSRFRGRQTAQLNLDVAARPSSAGDVETFRVLSEWQGYYRVVETYFQPQVRPRVKAIWKWMLDNSSDSARLRRDPDSMDAALRAFVTAECGEVCNLDTLATTKFRLRQRLEALRFVRDPEMEGGGADTSDAALLDHVRSGRGLAERDVPTLRALGALARSAKGEKSLGWALFARLLMDADDHTWQTARASCSDLLESSGVPADEVTSRLAIAARWQVHTPARRVWSGLRAEAKRRRMAFLLTPAWSLLGLRHVPLELSIERLLSVPPVPPSEEEWIRLVAARLEAGVP